MYSQLKEEWKSICSNDPSLMSMLEEKVVPLLLNTDEAFVKQGMDILMSFGSSGLCFLLEEENSEISIVSSYPGLSQWKMRDLRYIQKSFNLASASTKASLVERINKSTIVKQTIGCCVIEEVNKEDSDWFGLFESGSFDGMWNRIIENTEWNSLSKALQQRLLKEVRQMVEIPGKKYSIGKYAVTQGLWESVMGNNPSEFKGSSRPVEMVNWLDCVLFCNKLSDKEGLEKVYILPSRLEQALKNQTYWYSGSVGELSKEVTQNLKAIGYRLPTEWEWWFAAKANEDFKYSGSDNPDEVAWTNENSNRQTHAVGQKKANGFGLYDMSGNVSEWCWDWFEGENYDIPTEDSTGPSTGSGRVNRGGSWISVAIRTRVPDRGYDNPSYRRGDWGFRLTRTIR